MERVRCGQCHGKGRSRRCNECDDVMCETCHIQLGGVCEECQERAYEEMCRAMANAFYEDEEEET